ncbi:hypothetical protein COHCIP112018_02703 [Cohnella sp. JJ-181]|nr:hypothetical protein COHCIP112018_02703 [Cohnella sp. JJ-181]
MVILAHLSCRALGAAVHKVLSLDSTWPLPGAAVHKVLSLDSTWPLPGAAVHKVLSLDSTWPLPGAAVHKVLSLDSTWLAPGAAVHKVLSLDSTWPLPGAAVHKVLSLDSTWPLPGAANVKKPPRGRRYGLRDGSTFKFSYIAMLNCAYSRASSSFFFSSKPGLPSSANMLTLYASTPGWSNGLTPSR